MPNGHSTCSSHLYFGFRVICFVIDRGKTNMGLICKSDCCDTGLRNLCWVCMWGGGIPMEERENASGATFLEEVKVLSHPQAAE